MEAREFEARYMCNNIFLCLWPNELLEKEKWQNDTDVLVRCLFYIIVPLLLELLSV